MSGAALLHFLKKCVELEFEFVHSLLQRRVIGRKTQIEQQRDYLSLIVSRAGPTLGPHSRIGSPHRRLNY